MKNLHIQDRYMVVKTNLLDLPYLIRATILNLDLQTECHLSFNFVLIIPLKTVFPEGTKLY